MTTKHELEQRIAELEEALEQVRELLDEGTCEEREIDEAVGVIDKVLGIEG